MDKLEPGVWLIDDALVDTAPAPEPRLAMHDKEGEPYRRARNKAAAALYERTEDRALLESGASRDAHVTVLTCFPSGAVVLIEGTLRLWGGDQLVLLKRGSLHKGFPLEGPDALPVIEWVFGDAKENAQVLADTWADRLAQVPELVPAGFDAIPDADWGKADTEIHAVFLFDHPGFEGSGEGATAGCLFFAWDVQAMDEIVNGWLWAPQGSPLVSEHGSQYYSDMQRYSGRVRDFRPKGLSLATLRVPNTRREAYAWLGRFR